MKKTIKQHSPGIACFAFIEIFVGSMNLSAIILNLMQKKPPLPLEVFIFILATGLISLGLGLGILKYNPNAYHLLLFFSTMIIFSKILIFGKIISLSEALETAIPSNLKNIASIAYHSALIFYFTRKKIKKQFGKHLRSVIF